jgi:hypothetical protein
MHFAPWYRREDYALIREIMEDGETFPLDFTRVAYTMSDEELATEQEKQEVLAKLKAFLDQLEELEAKWRDLPEEQKLALPELAKFFGNIRR